MKVKEVAIIEKDVVKEIIVPKEKIVNKDITLEQRVLAAECIAAFSIQLIEE